MDFGYIIATVAATFGSVKALGSPVHEGEKGIKLTFGYAPRVKKGEKKGEIKVMGPKRFPIIVPFAQRVVKAHIKSNTNHLPDMRITLKNTLSYTFDAFVEYDILDDPNNLEYVLLTLEDWQEFITLNFKLAVQTSLYQYEATPEKMKVIGGDIKKELTKLITPKGEDDTKGFVIRNCGIINLSETATSQASRSVDYRISAAMEHLGTEKLSDCVLSACLGAMPTIGPADCMKLEPEGVE